jgi:Na+-translocating ferredoxin:NAD+ oxidoreductase subunit B
MSADTGDGPSNPLSSLPSNVSTDSPVTDSPSTGAKGRLERIEHRRRNDKWKNPPVRIEMSECINCDACLRHCPTQFGAIFNHGADVVIVPELCSGCDKCLPACPVNCIYPFPDWETTGYDQDWWTLPLSADDPY